MIGGNLNIILKIKYQKWTAKRGEFDRIRFHLFFISSVLSRMCTTLGPTTVLHYKLWESLSHSLKQSSYRPIMSVKQFNHLPRSKVPVQRMMNIFLKDISSILGINLSAPFNYCRLNYLGALLDNDFYFVLYG